MFTIGIHFTYLAIETERLEHASKATSRHGVSVMYGVVNGALSEAASAWRHENN